ncbi:MAG: surfeit locus 1 family protein [Gammaproteobacteria bacterium]|nr:surfeit locus 1 family protein [Gammaproteobacteria bacterium]
MFLAIVGTLAILFFVVFVALGTWQVKRRVWKLDLIARVEQRVHAPAVAAPGPAQWPNVTVAADEYRHVTATGTFLDGSQTLVQAVTDLGAGYWVLTPLRSADGSIVLVNRGFIPADDRNRVQPGSASPSATVTGLLRITEPHGGFLRHNDPAANQWYSRDVQAIAAARGLTRVAPYFIDAEALASAAAAPPGAPSPPMQSEVHQPASSTAAATAPPSREPDAQAVTNRAAPTGPTVPPTPGLTVVTFHNSHLVYAITWYTLALMVAIAVPLGLRKQ